MSLLSRCCKEELEVHQGDCSSYYVCKTCGKPSDPLIMKNDFNQDENKNGDV